MEDRQIDPEAMQAPAWLHLQNLKKLAKIVKQVAVTVHSKALDGLCRCAGYSDYSDALHRPRALSISFPEWRQEILKEFALAEDELLPEADLLVWYSRIFVSRGRPAARGTLGHLGSSADVLCQANLTDESIPRSVSPESGIVGLIAQREPLSYAGIPRQSSYFDEWIPESISHEETLVDQIRQTKPRVRR